MATRLHHRVRTSLRSFFRKRTVEHELDEELRFHYEQMAAAQAPTRRRHSGFDQVKEACRDMRTLRPLEHLLQDLRFGVRLLVRSPIFSTVAIVSLAVGIGANAAIFSLINAIVLRSLPVERPDELHVVEIRLAQDTASQRLSYPLFEAARDLVAGRAEMAAASSLRSMQIAVAGGRRSGSSVAPAMTSPATGAAASDNAASRNAASRSAASGSAASGSAASGPASGTGPPAVTPRDSTGAAQSAQVQLVSGEYFGLLRQRAQMGRLLTADDNRTLDGHPVAVISDGYWSRRFGRAHDVLDRVLVINGRPFSIVGVTAPGFFGTTVEARTPDAWVPLMMQASLRYAGNMNNANGDRLKPWTPQREISWLTAFVRAPAGSAPAVTEALNLALQRDLSRSRGNQQTEEQRRLDQMARALLLPGSRGLSDVRRDLTTPLVVLLVMVGLLLAITCANLASLLLARATSRQRELAIRVSIGAGRGRLLRQLLTESLLLALIGGGLGLLVAAWGSTALLTFATRGTRPTDIDLGMDWRVLAFTIAISVLTGVLFGLLPALRGTRVSLAETLKTHTRGAIGTTAAGGRLSIGKLLIAGQMAFSLLLLIVAALFARSLQSLMRVDIGFDRDRLLIARIDTRAAGYGAAELPPLYQRLVDRVAAVPGVAGVSLSKNGPFGNSRTTSSFSAEGYTPARDEAPTTDEEHVTPGYFRTVGLTIRHGRDFTPQDTAQARKVSIVNETIARRYFKDRNPIGQRWNFGGDFAEQAYEIVGVVQDARYLTLKGNPPNIAYRPVLQIPDTVLSSLEIRSVGDPATLANDVRAALRETEPRLPVTSIETLDARIARAAGQERLLTWVTMAFGAVALFLACLGLYGTISYAVTRRTMELGVRMALGADRGAVQWLILREALTLVIAGLIVGLPLALLAARAMATLLHGVTPLDPAANAGAIALLVVIAALAAWLPARRAARVDPLLALRAD